MSIICPLRLMQKDIANVTQTDYEVEQVECVGRDCAWYILDTLDICCAVDATGFYLSHMEVHLREIASYLKNFVV